MTPSYIAFETELGIMATYCHMNGDIEDLGRMLVDNYGTRALAHDVAMVGYITHLTDNLHASALSSTHHEGPHHFFDASEMYQDAILNGKIYFLYLYRNNSWFVCVVENGENWVEL